MVHLTAPLRLRSFARALRSRRSSIREILAAMILAAAVLLGYRLTGSKIELSSRLHLWYAEKELRVRQLFSAESATAANAAASTAPGESDFRLERSPFLSIVGEIGFRYHPLIDMTGTQFLGLDHTFKAWDFFGFRNDFNAYFDPGDYLYIVITGNSEAVGAAHRTGTIAQDLQEILSARSGKKYRVLNLAMNSATTANEINYFVNLGFNLHPRFVISHSFAMDTYYGRFVPPLFRKMGLFYYQIERDWSKLVHAGNYDAKLFEDETSRPPSERYLLEGLTRNLQRYRAIAQASGAKFIFGIQKFDESRVRGTPSEEGYVEVRHMYGEFQSWLRDHPNDLDVIDFNKFADIEVGPNDPIHTTQASARRIAEIYADHILALEGKQ